MPLRLLIVMLVSALAANASAQTKVRTETIKPPAPPAAQSEPAAKDGAKPAERLSAARAAKPGAPPEIISDLSRLPAPVARMRERILTAARSGELRQVVAVMRENAALPIFSLADDKDPAGYWKATYPDSEGVEILAILLAVLEAPFVHADAGTPQEVYLWPYFARMPLKALTPPQKVELFRIVTGADYREMAEFGAYNFYRLGIDRDGAWQFFVAGD